MREKQAGQVPEGRDREALSARDEHVLAQLDRAARDSDHDQGFEHSLIRVGELVAENHGDPKHELDLLLQRVDRLARDGADRERGAEPWRDGDRSAQRPGGSHTPARGTDEVERQLMVGVVRVIGPQLLDLVRGLQPGAQGAPNVRDLARFLRH